MILQKFHKNSIQIAVPGNVCGQKWGKKTYSLHAFRAARPHKSIVMSNNLLETTDTGLPKKKFKKKIKKIDSLERILRFIRCHFPTPAGQAPPCSPPPGVTLKFKQHAKMVKQSFLDAQDLTCKNLGVGPTLAFKLKSLRNECAMKARSKQQASDLAFIKRLKAAGKDSSKLFWSTVRPKAPQPVVMEA
jgi:hypothetical protein